MFHVLLVTNTYGYLGRIYFASDPDDAILGIA